MYKHQITWGWFSFFQSTNVHLTFRWMPPHGQNEKTDVIKTLVEHQIHLFIPKSCFQNEVIRLEVNRECRSKFWNVFQPQLCAKLPYSWKTLFSSCKDASVLREQSAFHFDRNSKACHHDFYAYLYNAYNKISKKCCNNMWQEFLNEKYTFHCSLLLFEG